MSLFTLDDLSAAQDLIRPIIPETPVYAWPLLKQRTGVEVYVKHENHTPTGAFKVRGGLVYLNALKQQGTLPKGLVTATRGNHGQSVALAAQRHGIPAVIVVPKGNSVEKNAAMRGLGAEVIIEGRDFDISRRVAADIAKERNFHMVPPFHPEIVKGVATYAHELFTAVQDLDVVYVPIGMGSGICGLITVRDLLGLDTEIVGVVAQNAPAFALSFEAGHPVHTNSAQTFADGMACREPQSEPLEIIRAGAARILQLTEAEIAEAIRVYYTDTHNIAEGAGAAPLAGLMREQETYKGKRAGVILCGSNMDTAPFAEVLLGGVPLVS